MVEGNNLFQVVWLTDEQREEYLRRAPAACPGPASAAGLTHRLRGQPAGRRQQEPAAQPAARCSDLARAAAVRAGLAGRRDRHQGPDVRGLPPPERQQSLDRRPERRGGPGDAHHGRSEHRRPASPARRRGGLRFYLFDGSPVDSPLSGELAKLERATFLIPSRTSPPASWARSSARSPPRSSAAETQEAEDQAPIYLMIYDIQRFRDLRKGDDDFGFSSSFGGEEKAASPSKSFMNILKDGPAVGVHVARLVRQREQPEPDVRPQRPARVRDPRPVPDERQRQQRPDRHARRRQARRQPGPLLQRGREPDREVPPLRPARPRMARPHRPPVPVSTQARAGRGSKRRWKW